MADNFSSQVTDWLNGRINAASGTIGRLLPRLQETFGAGAEVIVPDDLTVLANEPVYAGEGADNHLDYVSYEVKEREGGREYHEFRVVKLVELHAIPLDVRGDRGAVAKMHKVLRGVGNAGADIVYLVAGIYHPVRYGIVQCYGAVGRDRDRAAAIQKAERGIAAFQAGMAGGYPQIRFKPIGAEVARWISEALFDMPHGVLTVGQPDPRENARGGYSDINPLLAAGRKQAGQEFTLQQNEIVMRGMAAIEEDFLLQVLLSPVGMADASRILAGLAEYTSTWAAWQTGTRNFNVGTSLPLILSSAFTRSAGLGYTESQNKGVADGVSHVDSQMHTDGHAHTRTEGVAETDAVSVAATHGVSRTATDTTGHSESNGVNSERGWNAGVNASVSVNASAGVPGVASAGVGASAGVSAGVSGSEGNSHVETESASHSESVTESDSVTVARSHAVTRSQSDAETESQSDSAGTADGTNRTVSEGSGQALARGLSAGASQGLSFGLAPSLSMGEANQWQFDPAMLVVKMLREQQAQLESITVEGGFYADVYALARTERGKQALLALIPEAFHGTEGVVMGVQTRTLSPEEEDYLRLHAKVMVPSTREVRIPEAVTGYVDSTLLTPIQAAAYMTPGLMEEGLARTVQEAIPPFAYDPMMAGDVIVGYLYSTERGERTSSLLRLEQKRHFHTAFVADTGFGKSVAAERLVYETTHKWKWRTIVLDFGQGWRKALNWPGMEERVDIRQLYPGAVRPIRWNPLQIPKRTIPSRYRSQIVELFANAGRMGPRQLGFMRDALGRVYRDCGVIVDENNEADWGVVRNQEEEDAINAARLEQKLPARHTLNLRWTDLEGAEKQALAVFRSHEASLRAWVNHLKTMLIILERLKDQASRTSLQGVLLRLEPLAEDDMMAMYGPGYDTIAIEDLGLLGHASDRWGVAVIEGGAQMDEFSKSALLSLIAAILYEDAIVRRRESLAGEHFPTMQIVFEEANKVLAGVDTGATSDRDNAAANQTAQIFQVMWRDGRKYRCYLHILAQTISEIPSGILSSCNNGFFGQTKNDKDRSAILAHLARNNKGFVNAEYDRFLARMSIGMAIAKLGYTEEMRDIEPYLIHPQMLDVDEPSDADILRHYRDIPIVTR